MRWRSPIEWIRAASTSSFSQSLKARGSASRAATSARTADMDRSPSSSPRLRLGHVLERPRLANLLPGRSPRHLEGAGQPGSGGEESVDVEGTAPVELGQPPQPLYLQLLHGPLELGEVLLDALIGQLGQDLGPQGIDSRPELAHVASLSNIC